MIPARGTSARSLTGCPVSAMPPYSASLPTRAAASRAEPPRTTGQPTWCASAASSRPYPPVIGRRRSTMECAAIPASTARPRSPPNRVRPSTVAGSTPSAPYRASRSGARGSDSGESRESTRPKPPRAAAPTVSPPGEGVPPRAEPGRGLGHVPVNEDRVLPVERVRRLDRGEGPLDGQVEVTERGRRAGQRQHGGAPVMGEPVQPGQRPAAQAAAELVRRLEQAATFRPGAGERDGADSPFGPDPTTTASNPSAWFHSASRSLGAITAAAGPP